MRRSPFPRFHQTDLSCGVCVGGLQVTLLPRQAYETHHVARCNSLGVALDPQTGEDAIGTDRIRPFVAKPYSLAWLPKGCDVYSRSARGGEYLKIEGELPFAGDLPFNNRSPKGLREAIRELRRCLFVCRCDDPMLIDALFKLLTLIEPASSLDSGLGTLRGRQLQRILEKIEHQLSEPLSIESLARELNMSVGYFHRAFARTLGCTPHCYVMDRRLERVRQHLLSGDTPLNVVALENGFASHAHMTRRFTATYGCTPSDFRDACP